MSPCFGSRAGNDAETNPPDSIRELYEQQSSNNRRMSTEDFQKFLREYQGESERYVNEILGKYPGALELHDFFRYLREDSKPPLRKVDQVLDDAPLADYFIFTRVKISVLKTHKGKLRANYLKRNNALISEALKSGVRAIQLDLSTSLKNGSNITPQKEVLISKVLNACLDTIKEDAFQTNDYPVIVTFEGTLESSLQSKIVRAAELTLAKCWVDMDLKTSPLRDLKGKIIMPQLSKWISDTQEGERMKKIESLEPAKLKDELNKILTTNSDDIKWYKMTHPDLERATKHHVADLLAKYTKKHLLMVDPKEKSTSHSNINPLTGWIYGAQMVAVNTQGFDKHLWATHGLFRVNGNHGYVKKPKIMRNNDEVFDPDTQLPVKTTLKVKLHMGYGWNLDFSWIQFDTFSPPDFFVKVKILGVPADTAEGETEIAQNEWNPAWNQEFEFEIRVPELAFMRIEVRDFDYEDASAFWGQTCLPVWELKSGIRAVPLQDKQGVPYKSINLLMGFQFNDRN